jgi:hypothetical protein
MVFKGNQWLIAAVCLLAVMGLADGIASAQPTRQISPDMLAIQGRWVRTDAPYVIELRHAEGGSLQAAYYNPQPIHVARTELAEEEGLLQVMIELRDVNYPGSTYILAFDRAQDRLLGIYYHPASRQTFEVEFVRQVNQ